jgi:hypothetical protein
VLMLTRGVVVAALTLAAVVATALPAVADGGWGWTECEQNPHPGCELGAERDDGGTPDDGGGPDLGGPDAGGGGEEEAAPEEDNPDLMNCSYLPAPDYQPPADAATSSFDAPAGEDAVRAEPAVVSPGDGWPTAVPLAAPEPGEGPGGWYVWQCSGSGTRDAYYRPPVWIPETPGEDGEPGPSPAALAQRAYEQLQLPEPAIQASPSGDQLVQVPTWLWLQEWGEVSATAEVPGVSVTATARPESVEWSMGDGTTVECTGPGTPYRAQADPSSPSPDCGHTYRSSSAGQPDEAYPVEVQVRWTVTWSGAGQSGTFPGLTTTAETSFRVEESPALNTE